MTEFPNQLRRPEPGFAPVPVLVMPLAVWQKIMAYVTACAVEINGFGTIDRFGNTLHLDDVFILEQTATPGAVEVSPEALARHLTQMVQQGQDTSRVRFQWHSHVNMTAFFSGVDLANIEDYTSDWMVSMVTNKRGEYELRLDVYRPFRAWTPLELKVLTQGDPQLAQHCVREVTQKVRQPRSFGRSKPVGVLEHVSNSYLDGESIELWDV